MSKGLPIGQCYFLFENFFYFHFKFSFFHLYFCFILVLVMSVFTVSVYASAFASVLLASVSLSCFVHKAVPVQCIVLSDYSKIYALVRYNTRQLSEYYQQWHT